LLFDAGCVFQARIATFELYRRSTIGNCLTETLDEMVQNGTLSPELAIQVLVQFDKVGFRIGARRLGAWFLDLV
jgi:hypothetical protein